jgi:hypothetical protein
MQQCHHAPACSCYCWWWRCCCCCQRLDCMSSCARGYCTAAASYTSSCAYLVYHALMQQCHHAPACLCYC